MENIVFVNEKDEVIGAGSKEKAIEKGIIHRVVRIYLKNKGGKLLIQKRAEHMKAFPGKWTQSAAGHVDEGESYEQAAYRELKEEVGLSNIPLQEVGKWRDNEELGDRIKYQFCTLYAGEYSGALTPEPKEVAEMKWIEPEELYMWLMERPEDFTPTYLHTFRKYAEFIQFSIQK